MDVGNGEELSTTCLQNLPLSCQSPREQTEAEEFWQAGSTSSQNSLSLIRGSVVMLNTLQKQLREGRVSLGSQFEGLERWLSS